MIKLSRELKNLTSHNKPGKKEVNNVNNNPFHELADHQYVNATVNTPEPNTIKQALRGFEARQWKESAKEEVKNFLR